MEKEKIEDSENKTEESFRNTDKQNDEESTIEVNSRSAAESNGIFLIFTTAFSAFCAGLSMLSAHYLFDLGYERYNFYVFVSMAILCAAAFLYSAVNSIKNIRRAEAPTANRFLIAVFLAVNAYLLPEVVMDAWIIKSSILYNLLGIIPSLVIFLIGAAVFSKSILLKIWNILWTLVFALYSWAQFYVYEFRGDPVRFSDIFNISSGLEVEGSYSFAPRFMSVFIYADIIIVVFMIIVMRPSACKIKSRLISAATAVTCGAVLVLTGSSAYSMGINNRYIKWGFSGCENLESFRNVGFNLMFCYDGLYNRVDKPEGYSSQAAEDILSRYTTEDSSQKRPTIIGIMNESFADFSHIADFDTNEDYMPNYRRLCDESISGYVTVSAYGGYSCNSEYEFLTGDSMGFLPAGSAVFTQYLNEERESNVSYLRSLGYYTHAVTPCSSWLWNIQNAYNNLGFDKSDFDFSVNMSDNEYVNCNLSDSSFFKNFERVYNAKPTNQPTFYWLTTMQNHSPYDGECPAAGITLNNIDNAEAESYLSSIKLSDKALGELTDYFRNVDEEVIIVMFGDHYPHIMDFTEQLYGSSVSSLSTEDYSRLHQTPFIIWSNKGLEPERIENISLNYLSIEVFKAAGLPLNSYQQALDDIRKDIPIISGFGYKTADGKWHGTTDCSDYDKTKNKYAVLQYFRMFEH